MTSLADKVARVKGSLVFHPEVYKEIITQLWDENQKQREVLVMAREAMIAYLTGPTQQSLVMDAWDSARDALIGNPTSSLGRDIFESVIDEVEGNLRNALTAIDNVMNLKTIAER